MQYGPRIRSLKHQQCGLHPNLGLIHDHSVTNTVFYQPNPISLVEFRNFYQQIHQGYNRFRFI